MPAERRSSERLHRERAKVTRKRKPEEAARTRKAPTLARLQGTSTASVHNAIEAPVDLGVEVEDRISEMDCDTPKSFHGEEIGAKILRILTYLRAETSTELESIKNHLMFQNLPATSATLPVASSSGASQHVTYTPLYECYKWIADKSFFDKACSGLLAPLDLTRLVNPGHKYHHHLAPSPSLNQVATSSWSRDQSIFISTFSTIQAFIAAWSSYGHCMAYGNQDGAQTSEILAAVQWHLCFLLSRSMTFEWSACLGYHYSCHVQRMSEGPFLPALWTNTISSADEAEFFNTHTLLHTPSPVATKTTTTAHLSVPGPSGGGIQKKQGSSARICYAWNGGDCLEGTECPLGYVHNCRRCHGNHRARHCRAQIEAKSKGKEKETSDPSLDNST